MAEQLYKVVFEGEILEGSQVQEVKRALAKLYNTTEDQVERFFSGKRLAIKKDVDYETAMKYVKAFEQAGAVCRAEEVEPNTGLEQPLMLEKDREEPSQQEEVMVCPKCQFEQEPSEECLRCGIIISKYSERLHAPESERIREDTRIEPQPRSFKLLTISAGLLVLLLVAGFYYFSGTPRYSLYKIGRAFKNHDSEEFHKYVDVDRIVDHLTKYAVEQALAEMEGNEPTGNWGGAGQQIDKELAMMMLPTMMEALKPQIKQAITDLIEDRGDDREGSPFLGASLAGIQTEGSTSQVTVQDEDTGQEIRFKMVKTPDRYWKIVEIDFESFQAISNS
ncbi:MAG: DUF2939 domain-containing protein [Deltaproteobacteria bacterium]|nr:DUF2939 domain-containing protein [Deltaproteobacteria bacterium]